MEWTALYNTELIVASKTSATMKGYYVYTDLTTAAAVTKT